MIGEGGIVKEPVDEELQRSALMQKVRSALTSWELDGSLNFQTVEALDDDVVHSLVTCMVIPMDTKYPPFLGLVHQMDL